MKIYQAPLEGVTNHIYRRAYHAHFEKLDKYFTPFISTNQHIHLSSKEVNEILPENNIGMVTVPQILSNKADDFIETAKVIREYGYDEINLNLGCPSNTVVAKNKGSGFLYLKDELNRFLDDIYAKTPMKISIKTRHGKYGHDEFLDLCHLFNQYPVHELIIHPRIQKDMYKNTPNLEVFEEALAVLKMPVCYNGDLFNGYDVKRFSARFPGIETIMLGRGLIGNPGLPSLIKNGTAPSVDVYRAFHDHLYAEYRKIMHGDKNVLFKMKELWYYLIPMFDDSKKVAKKIKKCENLKDYEQIVSSLFSENSFNPDSLGYRHVVNGD